jgi:hypothetical protein
MRTQSWPNLAKILITYLTWTIGVAAIFLIIITIIARPIVMVGFVAGVFVSFSLRDLPIGRELDRIIERLHVIYPRG